MPKEYYILSGIKRNGDRITKLISREAVSNLEVEEDYRIEDWFPYGTTDIKMIGTIQITGDTEFLDEVYESEV
jgi:hypothetical protein